MRLRIPLSTGCQMRTMRRVVLIRKRDFLSLQRYRSLFWKCSREDHHIGKATLKFGSKNKKQLSDEYQFVFEDQIDFIKALVMDGDEFDDEGQPSEVLESKAKTALEKLQDIALFRPDLKLLISSATLGAKKFSDDFDSANFQNSGEAEEIETAEEILKHRTRGLGTKFSELIICPIYANLPTELQAKFFEATPNGARKVVLATNIAETSLTIDGIKYVIDPVFCKFKSYNPRTGDWNGFIASYSHLKGISNAEGSLIWSNGSWKVLPCLGIHDLLHFDFMDPLPSEALLKALELLFALSALNKVGELTEVGRRMAEFPLDPMLFKMIVASDKYKCLDEVISIAAMLSIGNSIFYRPKDKQVHVDNARLNFHTRNVGDHIALLKVYNSWKETNFSTQCCYENYLQVRSMKRARDIIDQLEGLLERVEIELVSNLSDYETLKKAITSGFFPHSTKLQKNGSYRTVKHSETVHIHPSSGLSQVLPRWVIYQS
ncbi:pre-mRNA-splicing factor ATP-dependent RNA helicase DEAH1 isoform X2 [Prunus yedoensis var. nudiflora]|uniref:RNA helicase n=1 Tax=Prunus yedoensis var. nudiflora TaxID=2094558 RepID=A0A314YS61_PRUYE|nr:pre-mRNA-splicing factor ATP-dependent RNA helicase DEAH1 isoform X2 [Prunus yedoensis var. nudiflora]